MGRLDTQRLSKSTEPRRLSLDKGTTIVEQGKEDNCFYKVISGTLKKYLTFQGRRSQIVRFLDEEDLFETHSRPSTFGKLIVEAITPTEIYYFNHHMFQYEREKIRLLLTDVQKAKQVELMKAQTHISMLGQETAREKVASFLLDRLSVWEQKELKRTSNKKTKAKAVYAYLPMKMSDVSNYLGIKTETLSRMLTSLSNEGIIASKKAKHICIYDFYKLINITTSF